MIEASSSQQNNPEQKPNRPYFEFAVIGTIAAVVGFGIGGIAGMAQGNQKLENVINTMRPYVDSVNGAPSTISINYRDGRKAKEKVFRYNPNNGTCTEVPRGK